MEYQRDDLSAKDFFHPYHYRSGQSRYRNTRRLYFSVDSSPDRRPHTGDCLYQFHEPGHGPGFEARQGGWGAEGNRRRTGRPGSPVPGGIFSFVADWGIDRSAFTDAGAALAEWYYQDYRHAGFPERLSHVADAGRIDFTYRVCCRQLSRILSVCF